MVEFKDDGTATTPGKPWENRDAESAVVADLVAVELDDAGLNLNTKPGGGFGQRRRHLVLPRLRQKR